MTNIANKLKKLRKEKDLSQEALLEEINKKQNLKISISAYRNYENVNNPRIPKMNILLALSNFFDVDMRYLLDNAIDIERKKPMTNAEKYLKDGVSIKEFADKLDYEGLKQADYQARGEIVEWLEATYKELTVDEQLSIHEHIDEIITSAIKFKYNEKEKAMLQEIIREQQKQIEDLKRDLRWEERHND